MKVSELKSAQLDYWVGKAEGLKPRIGLNGECYTFDGKYFPSTNWAQGGPIIEKEKIISVPPGNYFSEWVAIKKKNRGKGSTPLIAAMRCYVASKYGGEVKEKPCST